MHSLAPSSQLLTTRLLGRFDIAFLPELLLRLTFTGAPNSSSGPGKHHSCWCHRHRVEWLRYAVRNRRWCCTSIQSRSTVRFSCGVYLVSWIPESWIVPRMKIPTRRTKFNHSSSKLQYALSHHYQCFLSYACVSQRRGTFPFLGLLQALFVSLEWQSIPWIHNYLLHWKMKIFIFLTWRHPKKPSRHKRFASNQIHTQKLPHNDMTINTNAPTLKQHNNQQLISQPIIYSAQPYQILLLHGIPLSLTSLWLEGWTDPWNSSTSGYLIAHQTKWYTSTCRCVCPRFFRLLFELSWLQLNLTVGMT